MTLKPYSRTVTHVDFYRRSPSIVRKELWDAAVNHLTMEILKNEYLCREIVSFLRAAWPEVAYSILEKSPSFEYSKEQFLALAFSSQQQWTGPAHGLIRLMQAVESKMKLMNHIVKVIGSEGVIV